MDFILAFIQRVLSGAASYFGYSNRATGLIIVSFLMLLLPFVTYETNWFHILFYEVNALVLFMKAISFDMDTFKSLNKYKDIHLWENLVTGGYVVYLSLIGYNIILIMCATYPALILHKGLINLGSKLPFFAEATDDATGKTYGIPLLGIKIKRSSTKFRLILAGISLVVAVLAYVFNISIHYSIL